jgi:hypothetical protein
MILGHLAIASIAKRKLLAENFIFLSVASYGPDLVDKTLNLTCGAPGRGVAHSLLMLVMLMSAGWLFGKRFRINKQLLYIGLILWLSHLITDMLELNILLWPFLGPFPDYPNYTFVERLFNYYIIHTYPAQLFLEISLTIVAITLWIFYSLRASSDPLPNVPKR